MLFFIFAFCLLVVMPTILGSIALITDHKRKMAQIQADALAKNSAHMEALEQRLSELTQLVHEQTIALDGLHRPTAERIEQRIRS